MTNDLISFRTASIAGLLVAGLLGIAAVLPVTELARAAAPPPGPAVVELFTSQGCSSCPPADAVLGELAARPDVLALAFHVDYWDGLGWRDPFASPAATDRQRRYVEALGLSSAFTPQAIVDGRRSVVGSDRSRLLAALTEARDTINLRLEVAADGLTIALPERAVGERFDVELVAYRPRATTGIGRGENSGRTLTEFNIVRQFRVLGTWTGQPAVLHASLDSIPADATRVAVLLQRDRQGPILGSGTAILR